MSREAPPMEQDQQPFTATSTVDLFEVYQIRAGVQKEIFSICPRQS
jgi:hypothetical protein